MLRGIVRNGKTDYYAEMAAAYDGVYEGRQPERENALVRGILKKEGIGKGRVYDIGCGTGLGFHLLGEPEDTAYTGLDLSPKMAYLMAKKYPRATACVGDMERAHNYITVRQDAVISLFGAISYVNDPVRTFRAIRKCLKVGAPAFVMGYAPAWGFRQNKATEKRGVLAYRLLYTPELLAGSAKRAGMKVEWVRPMSVLVGRAPKALWGMEKMAERLMPRRGLYTTALLRRTQ